MCFQFFFSIKVMLKPSENIMNSHFHGGTTEQFWVKDVSFYLIFLCIFWQFFEFCFAQNFKLSVNYLKNSFPCSKNYLICLNLSLNTPYFTSVFPSQWSLNLMAVILLVIVLLCGGGPGSNPGEAKLWRLVTLKPFEIRRSTLHFWKIPTFI